MAQWFKWTISLMTYNAYLVQMCGIAMRIRDQALVLRTTDHDTDSPIYVEDSSEGAAVENAPLRHLKIGDQLLVTFWPEENGRGLVFRGASIWFLWPGKPMPPSVVTSDQAALGKFAGSPIEVQGGPTGDGLHSVENPRFGTI